MKKLKREDLRKILLEEIKKIILNEVDEIKIRKRGSEISHPGGKKEYKIKSPGGYGKLMFATPAGTEKEKEKNKINVNGLDSKVTQDQHRVSVPYRGTTYVISGSKGIIKVKPVKSR